MPLNSAESLASTDPSLQGGSDAVHRQIDRADASASSSAESPPVGNPRSAARRTSKGAAARGEAAPTPAAAQPIKIPKIKSGLPLRKRPQEARRIAIEVFASADSWVIFYREILGVDGVVRKLFKNVDEIRHWESSDEFYEVQEMLTALRSNDSGKGESVEPQRMITIRLPTSLHETLKVEAKEHRTSMNKLCLSKLIMSISDRFVPIESGRIRGRKPGPQGKRKVEEASVMGEKDFKS